MKLVTEAYLDGKAAFKNGVPRSENPYSPGRGLISWASWESSWNEGWDDAEKEVG